MRRRMVNVACVLGLLALALMVWSVLDPRPIPVFLAMTFAQVIGTASLALFVAIFFVPPPSVDTTESGTREPA